MPSRVRLQPIEIRDFSTRMTIVALALVKTSLMRSLHSGQQIAIQAGIVVDDGLDFRDGSFVVSALDPAADPQLGVIGANHLVGDFGASDM